MSLRSLLLLVLVAAVSTAQPGQAQEPIARIKSAPQDYRDRQIQLEGEVVEVRGLSPRSGRGTYRLLDESDPVGLLVRTTSLPETGGPFRVRARLSPELLQGGILLVDELDRDLTRSPMLPLAFLVGALGLLGCLVLAGMYLRARRMERHLRLAPPTWLIPAAVEEPATESDHGKEVAPVHFNYRLHHVEQERSSSLERRKRQLLTALAGAALVAAAGGGWFAVLRGEDAARPAFVLTTPSQALAVATPRDSAVADSVPAPVGRTDDTLRIGLAAPVVPGPAPRPVASDTARRRAPRDTTRPQPAGARRDTTPFRRDTTPFRQDTARVGAPVVVVTGGASAAVDTTPRPVVAVVPPPPPPVTEPPVRRDTAPTPPPPDPAVLRRAAAAELDRGIQRFVAALEGKQVATVAAGFSGAGDTRRRDQFLDFLRESAPSATLKGTEQPAVTESSAEATFTVAFRWRAQFGVERKRDARFAATARRSGEGWAFGNIRLLEAFP